MELEKKLSDILFNKNTNTLYGQVIDNVQDRAQREQMINVIGNSERDLYDSEYWDEIVPKWIGAGAEIGSAFIPETKGGFLAEKLYSALSPVLGRKAGAMTAQNAVKGAGTLGLFGYGDGLVNDRNPYSEALKSLGIGLAASGGLGFAGAKAQQLYRGNVLKNFGNANEMTKPELKSLRNTGKKYYQDYIQGTSVNHPEIGSVGFTRKGLDEIGFRNPNAYRELPEIKNDIKNARFLETNDLYHPRYDRFNKFHTLENKENIYKIGQDEQLNKLFYSVNKNNSISKPIDKYLQEFIYK